MLVALFSVGMRECGNFGTYLVCRLRARYGVCFKLGSMSIVAVWLVSLCLFALYMACSSALVSLSGCNSGSERVILVHVVRVSDSAEKSSLSGSSE